MGRPSTRGRTPVDVAVVGAGLAGASAAALLRAHDLSVTVLEARHRVGGRGYVRRLEGGSDLVDFGGAWITPWQSRIRALCAEHGVTLRPRHPVVERRWFRDGRLHLDGPVAPGDLAAHEAVLARIAADGALLAAGSETDEDGAPLGVDLAAYLDRLAPPQATRDLVSAWWTVSGNGAKKRVPATEFLASCAHGDGTPDGICTAWQDTLVGGVPLLAERMIAGCGAELRMSCAVVGIEQSADAIAVRLADGGIVPAGWCVVATGLNPLRDVRVDPGLPPFKTRALEGGHLGRAVKVWTRLRGVAVGVLATGGGGGIEWMLSEREADDGTTLAVGFGVADAAFDIEQEARAAAARFFPEAELVGVDWHDWNADRYAQGAWVAPPVGDEAAFGAGAWGPEGRLAFASSDVAPGDAGWFEGAILSGERAARSIALVAA